MQAPNVKGMTEWNWLRYRTVLARGSRRPCPSEQRDRKSQEQRGTDNERGPNGTVCPPGKELSHALENRLSGGFRAQCPRQGIDCLYRG